MNQQVLLKLDHQESKGNIDQKKSGTCDGRVDVRRGRRFESGEWLKITTTVEDLLPNSDPAMGISGMVRKWRLIERES